MFSIEGHKSPQESLFLNHISYIHGHFFDAGTVELFYIFHGADIIFSYKVDGDTLPTKSTATTYTMNVVLTIGRQVVVDYLERK